MMGMGSWDEHDFAEHERMADGTKEDARIMAQALREIKFLPQTSTLLDAQAIAVAAMKKLRR